MPQNVEDKIDWLTGQILSRETWLNTHGTHKKPWPQHDIEAKQRGLIMLTEIRDDYAKSLAKAREKSE